MRRKQHGPGEQREGLSLAAAGGVPRVPKEQVLAARYRMQVCPSPSSRRGPERQGYRLLRLNKGSLQS